MIQHPIYMDYQATTPVDTRVLEAMLPYFSEKFGNAASRQHKFGWVAEEAVERSRALIAANLGAQSKEIIFMSGATESNNLALKGIAEGLRQKGNHIITLPTEHKSVLDCCKRLAKQGYDVSMLPVDEYGMVDVESLRKFIKPTTILISVMIANNEIGTIQMVEEIGKLCRDNGIVFHADAAQAVGKIMIDVVSMNIDLMSFSGHKIYGPKGIGALYVRTIQPKMKLVMQMDGGGHERGIRSGTLNVPGIVGLAKALELCTNEIASESKRLSVLRDKLLNSFTSELGDVYLNGHSTQRLPNNLNVSFMGVEDNALMMSMKEVAVSTGSACSTADPEPSHVLKALRLSSERLHSSIRFGLGRFTTEEEVDYVIGRVIENVKKLRELSPIYRKSQRTIISA